MAIDARRTVGELVAERISRAAVLDRFGIDYCCHGRIPLDEACRRRGLDLGEVVGAVSADDATVPESADFDYASMRLTDLVDQIEASHHGYTKRELPRLQALLAKVIQTHGDEHPELWDVATTLSALRDEIEAHQEEEERVLFPLIRKLEAGACPAGAPCDGVKDPIRAREHEHESAGAALARMRGLTDNYATPADGCVSYQMLMEGLADVEADLHRHIHKENNILFPKAAALEAELAGV